METKDHEKYDKIATKLDRFADILMLLATAAIGGMLMGALGLKLGTYLTFGGAKDRAVVALVLFGFFGLWGAVLGGCGGIAMIYLSRKASCRLSKFLGGGRKSKDHA